MLYCPGSGQELLPTLGVIVVCQDSKNFLMQELPLSMMDALLKSINSSFHPLKTAVQAAESLCLLIFLARERFLIF